MDEMDEQNVQPNDLAERIFVKKIMKSVSSPYDKFPAYYPLSDTVDMYMEIWYDDSSDS